MIQARQQLTTHITYKLSYINIQFLEIDRK